MSTKTEFEEGDEVPMETARFQGHPVRRHELAQDGADGYQSDFVPSDEDYARQGDDMDDYESDEFQVARKRRKPAPKREAKRVRKLVDPIPRDEHLFEETSIVPPGIHREVVDRRLDKAISRVSLEILESVRIGQKNLLHMLEHPRFDEYIFGAYVRYPDLELIEAEGQNPANVSTFLPAQISRVTQLSKPDEVRVEREAPCLVLHELTILQYTQRHDGSLKIRKSRADLNFVSNEPFTARELEKWRSLLRLFSGRAGADKLKTLPQILSVTAQKLRDFTFTDEDVATILTRKSEKRDGVGGVSALNWRALYLRRSEVEFLLHEMDRPMDEGEEDSSASSVSEGKKSKLESELREINKRLAILRDEDKNSFSGGMIEASNVETPSSIPSIRGSNDSKLLTPRSISTKSTDWRTMDGIRTIQRPSWTMPPTKLDSLCPNLIVENEVEWKIFIEREISDFNGAKVKSMTANWRSKVPRKLIATRIVKYLYSVKTALPEKTVTLSSFRPVAKTEESSVIDSTIDSTQHSADTKCPLTLLPLGNPQE